MLVHISSMVESLEQEGNAQPQLAHLEVGQQPLRGLEQNRNLPGESGMERSVT